MKSNILFLSLFLFSCVTHKVIVHTEKYTNTISFHISIDSDEKVYVHVKPKFDTGSIIISNPSLFPITSIDLFDKNDQLIPLPKGKISIDFKKEVIKLNFDQVFMAMYVDLKKLVPDKYKQIKKIKATYFYLAYINSPNLLTDSLVLK